MTTTTKTSSSDTKVPPSNCGTDTPTTTTRQVQPLSPMDDHPDDLLQEVLSWLGKGEYLFVALINPRFRKAYNATFGNKTLVATVFSTIPRAKLSFAEYVGLEDKACEHAATGGHLEVLKWARNQGCDWDWRTCAYAARSAHFNTSKWPLQAA